MMGTNVICFGGCDWWYHNRGHMDMQMMQRFAKKGTVLYINSIVMTKPKLSNGHKLVTKVTRKVKSIFMGLKWIKDGLWVYSPFSLPVQHLNWARPLNESILAYQINRASRKIGISNPVIWIASPIVYDIASKITKRKLVYQRTDRFEDFPDVDVQEIKNLDYELKLHADLTVYVNTTLYESERNQCKKALYLDHGVDYEMFALADKNRSMPSDMLQCQRPIIGFIGSIDDCNPDIDFIGRVADLLPEMSFVFIGQALSDCSGLESLKNVWMLGKKSYEEVPLYGKSFDVLVLPLRQSRWSEAVNPAKFKEYLALGKPVVATPFPELEKYLDVVYKAETPDEFAKCIKTAISEDNDQLIVRRREKVRHSTWDSKAQVVFEELFKTGS